MTIKIIISFCIFSFALLLSSILSFPEQALAATWNYEGIAWYTVPATENNAIVIYRFWSDQNQSHFYTASEEEKNHVINAYDDKVWRYEGAAYSVHASQIAGTIPVYRFWSDQNQSHFYTASEEEKNHVINAYDDKVWRYEGAAYYIYPSQIANSNPVYRFWSNDTQSHFYTASEEEKNLLMQGTYGPSIAVGLWYYDKSDIQNDPFEIEANKNYNIRDKDNNVIAQISGGTRTKVTYDTDGNLKIYGSITDKLIQTAVTFDAADGDNTSLIFNVHRPDSSYDEYRGKITLRYYKGNNIIAGTSDTVTQIWVINTLPLEHYVWGMGETTGTGDIEHTKVMTTIFRTYGRWYIEYATKYAPLGFKIRSDSGSQIYKGYKWEQTYQNITKAANATRGSIATYGSEIALTPYSSWSDGRTRSYKERWGSSDYPWCKSVDDSYGKNSTMTTKQLEDAGNHMVGLIANGSLVLARDKDWSYDRIMKYYYSGISLEPLY